MIIHPGRLWRPRLTGFCFALNNAPKTVHIQSYYMTVKRKINKIISMEVLK